jgi:hypothetical protein
METDRNSDRFVAYFSWYRASVVLVFSVAVSVYFLTAHPRDVSNEVALLEAFAILIFGAGCFAFLAHGMLGPQLIIDRQGIFWARPRRDGITIPWSSVERVEAWRGFLFPYSYLRRFLRVWLGEGRSIDIDFNPLRPGSRAAADYLQRIGRPAERHHSPRMREYAKYLRATAPPPSDKD